MPSPASACANCWRAKLPIPPRSTRITSDAPTPSSSPCPNTDNVQIRPATPADIPRIRQIEQQAATAAHWTTDQYESLCLPDDWEIESVVVDESARRRGIGSLLIRELLGRAVAAGATAVMLEVRESNAPARQLYEKIGFIQEYRRKDYYSGPFEHAIVYRLPLQNCDKFP